MNNIDLSVVVIGRNEGSRLLCCLESVRSMNFPAERRELIYVDSASRDGSPERAAALGARVLRVDPPRPSAALGRNAGWHVARGRYVLFLDGDTLLHPDFVKQAMAAFSDPEVAVVWGQRREIAPGASLYNRVLDFDWIYPPGDSAFCGGDALMRREVLHAVGGFDATLIAGEEPELCRRIRALGHRVVHLDAPMTGHDLAIHTFRAYWRRAFRAGYAYAEVAARFAGSPDPLWAREVRNNLLRGAAIAGFPLLLAALPGPFATAGLLAAAGLVLRSAWRCRWKTPAWSDRLLYAVHSHFQHLPMLAGQLAWRLDRQARRNRQLIEYKEAP